MINAIINGILNIIIFLIDLMLTPINALFENVFPDMTASIARFNTFVNTYLGDTLSYFFSILPPTFKDVLIIWFTFVIAYYTVYFVYNGTVKIFELIQKIKFW